MTTTIPEMEIIELSEFEYERPCTPTEPYTCSSKADWLAVKKCCGAEVPLCDSHKRLHLEIVASSPNAYFTCKFCGHSQIGGNLFDGWVKL